MFFIPKWAIVQGCQGSPFPTTSPRFRQNTANYPDHVAGGVFHGLCWDRRFFSFAGCVPPDCLRFTAPDARHRAAQRLSVTAPSLARPAGPLFLCPGRRGPHSGLTSGNWQGGGHRVDSHSCDLLAVFSGGSGWMGFRASLQESPVNPWQRGLHPLFLAVFTNVF